MQSSGDSGALRSAEIATVRMVSGGKISIGLAAELLDRSHHEIYLIAQENGIELGATDEQRGASGGNSGLLVMRKGGPPDDAPR